MIAAGVITMPFAHDKSRRNNFIEEQARVRERIALLEAKAREHIARGEMVKAREIIEKTLLLRALWDLEGEQV